MNIPKLTDISPELRRLEELYETLEQKKEKAKAEAHRLNAIKMAGIDPDRNARVASIAAGQEPDAPSDLSAAIEKARLEWGDTEDAQRLLDQQLSVERRNAGIEICKQLKPEHDTLIKRIAVALCEAQAAHSEYSIMRRSLIDSGAGLKGIFDLEPDRILGSAFDRNSNLADFLRAALNAGYIRKVPEFAK